MENVKDLTLLLTLNKVKQKINWTKYKSLLEYKACKKELKITEYIGS